MGKNNSYLSGRAVDCPVYGCADEIWCNPDCFTSQAMPEISHVLVNKNTWVIHLAIRHFWGKNERQLLCWCGYRFDFPEFIGTNWTLDPEDPRTFVYDIFSNEFDRSKSYVDMITHIVKHGGPFQHYRDSTATTLLENTGANDDEDHHSS
jgi:hypothetical protein